MKRNKALTATAVSILMSVSSCSDKKATTLLIDKFPVEETLQGKRIDPEDSEYLSNIASYAGDYLMCRTIKAPWLFNIYDRDFNLIDTIVTHGEGPEELQQPLYYGQFSGDRQSPKVLVYDDAASRMVSFDIRPFGDMTTVLRFPTSESLSPSSVYQVNDTLYAGINLSIDGGTTLFTFNSETKAVRRVPSEFEFDKRYAFYVSQCRLAMKGDGENYCVAYSSFPWILLYDSDFNLTCKIGISKTEIDTSTLTGEDNLGGFISAAYRGDRLIVLHESGDSEVGNSLMVFDSDGKPEARYYVGDAIWFAVAPDSRQVVTTAYDVEADHIYFTIYTLPE